MSTTAAEAAPDDSQVARAQFDCFIAETRKFSAEQNKLAAEAAALERDRAFAPLVIGATILATLGSGTLVAVISHVWR